MMRITVDEFRHSNVLSRMNVRGKTHSEGVHRLPHDPHELRDVVHIRRCDGRNRHSRRCWDAHVVDVIHDVRVLVDRKI